MASGTEAPQENKANSGKRDLLTPTVWTGLLFGLRKTPFLCKPPLTAQSRRKTYDADSNFRCPTYKSMYGECTMHFIKASTLDSLVDEAIRKVAAYVLKDEQAFLQQVKELTSASQAVVQTDSKKELVTAKKRIAELDNFIKKLYEGNASGKIPDRQFEKLMAQYDTEQQELEARVAEIEAKISELRQEEESGEMFVRLVKRYRDFTEITQTMLNEFIDKIVIYEATGGRTVNRSQRIDIYFNFIGQFVVEDTEEESLSRQEEEKRLAELKEQERKERRNETVRRYRQRKKEKKPQKRKPRKRQKGISHERIEAPNP